MKIRLAVSILFAIVNSLLLVSCSLPVSKEQLNAYVLNPENGLIHSAERNGIEVTVVYRPKEIMLDQLINQDDPIDVQRKVLADVDSLDYFVVRFSRDGHDIVNSLAGSSEFPRVVSYLSSNIADHLFIKTLDSEIPVESLIYQQGFGIANSSDILIVFKSALTKTPRDFTLIVDDSQLGSGRNSFDFLASDIERIPPLKK